MFGLQQSYAILSMLRYVCHKLTLMCRQENKMEMWTLIFKVYTMFYGAINIVIEIKVINSQLLSS